MSFKRTCCSLAAFGIAAIALSGCVAPPPATPLPSGSVVLSQQCFAGFYTCTAAPAAPGTPCACPGLGAPSYGTIR